MAEGTRDTPYAGVVVQGMWLLYAGPHLLAYDIARAAVVRPVNIDLDPDTSTGRDARCKRNLIFAAFRIEAEARATYAALDRLRRRQPRTRSWRPSTLRRCPSSCTSGTGING